MPSSYVIGPHFEAFIKEQIRLGRYANASEVIRDGLRTLEAREQYRAAQLEALRLEIREGLDSGPATALDMDDVRAEGRRLRAEKQKRGSGSGSK